MRRDSTFESEATVTNAVKLSKKQKYFALCRLAVKIWRLVLRALFTEFVKFRLDELCVLSSPKFCCTTPKFKFDDASLVKFNAEFDESIGKFQAYRFRYPSV